MSNKNMYIQTVFPAACLTLAFVSCYGGAWINGATWLIIAWADLWLTKQETAPHNRGLCNV